MNLGTFQPFVCFASVDDDDAAAGQSTAVWRLPPDESLSD
jgi:hypothetical protein